MTGLTSTVSDAAAAGSGPLRVLMFLRSDTEAHPGGDEIEAQRLCRGLAAAGHQAFVALPGSSVVRQQRWDVVHVFNIDRAPEVATFLDRYHGFPGSAVVLSPLYGRPPADSVRSRGDRHLRAVANLARGSLRPTRHWLPGVAVATLASAVRGLVFHTQAERDGFSQEHPQLSGLASSVIPPPVVTASVAQPPGTELPDPFVAVIGRIEPTKNQVWLLSSDLPDRVGLVFVGALSRKRPLYSRRFLALVRRRPGTCWLGPCSPAVVRWVLERAAAHLLPSRQESFGLVTAEALSLGCEAIVPQHHGLARDLAGAVHTFDLGQPATLYAAVDEALHGPLRAGTFDAARYSSERVVADHVRLYRQVITAMGGG